MYLDLGANGLTGAIPVELSRASNLETIRLANNDLTGALPAALGNLTTLEELLLVRNNLSDCILAALLRVHDNDLSKLKLPTCS